MDRTVLHRGDFDVRPVTETDRSWVVEMVREWGADFVVSRGRKIYPQDLPGFCAVGLGGERLGLAMYEVTDNVCQVVTMHALRQWQGIGTALLATVREAATEAGCSRLWLITTNDNLEALRFYQRRGMRLVAVHRDLREVARRVKPQIPLIGNYGIPLRDEIVLEMMLQSQPSPTKDAR
jgi:ribosomal protein S18 acetylase RimI-like enzyme